MSSPEKPEDKTAVITRPGAESTPGDDPTVQTSSGQGSSGGDAPAPAAPAEQEAPAAPPPWARVTSDAQYAEAQQVGPGDPPTEQPAEGSAPAYPAQDPDTVAVARPVIT
ncbi:MAG: hypothetical protein HOY78_43185, partial [Saccharothrix sp.]|nr:hypothetical protein [Saccharothrix sp.]